MRQRRRFFGVFLAGVVWAACGGGDGTGPGASAASITGIAGDNQSAPTGTALGAPLSFVALNSSGQPVQGVRVTWGVSPSGAASFNPAVDTTDTNGSVSTTVTTTTFIGNITISAAVTGVPNVVYHATVVNPCSFLAPYTLGQTVNGSLSATDCNQSSFFYDFYGLSLPAGQQSIRISMHPNFPGPSFFPPDSDDAWLDLFNPAGQPVAFDDDSILGQDGARNSQLDIILPGGNYVIGASSFAQLITGSYALTTANRSAAMNGCRQVWVMRGVTVSDSVTLSDCADSAATPHHYDVARIIAFQGSVLQLAERSAAINPSLALYRVRIDSVGDYVRTLVASNDDSSASNTNAFIRFAVDTSDFYDVVIGASAGGVVGGYTFSVDTTTTLSPRRVPATTGAREWWRPNPDELFPSWALRKGRGAKL